MKYTLGIEMGFNKIVLSEESGTNPAFFRRLIRLCCLRFINQIVEGG